jgi:hypothetical protein
MRFAQEGEWVVSTPMYMGAQKDVEKANLCPHNKWTEETRALEKGHVMVMERCLACRAATRVKYRPVRKEDLP